MDGVAVRTKMDESSLERLLGLDNSKIGFYAEVKQKIHELEAANLMVMNSAWLLCLGWPS